MVFILLSEINEGFDETELGKEVNGGNRESSIESFWTLMFFDFFNTVSYVVIIPLFL